MDQFRYRATLFSVLALACSSAYVADAPLLPGSYATEGGWGELSLEPADQPGLMLFNLQTVTAGHVCEFNGQLDMASGVAEPAPREPASDTCTLQLAANADGVQVDDTSPASADACRQFCGSNGSYVGHYPRLDSSCTWQALQAVQTSAAQARTPGQRHAAIAILQPLVGRCTPALSLSHAVQLRSQLALQQAAVGDGSGCRATLARWQADAAKDEQALREGAAPSWAQELLPAMDQVRQTLARCDTPASP